jgi:hypothetical protein
MSSSEQPNGQSLENVPELETVCPECEAEQNYNGNPCGPWEPCGTCDGAGYLPTKFGKKILQLLRHDSRRRHLRYSR